MKWGNIRGTFHTWFEIRTLIRTCSGFGKFEFSPFEIETRTCAFETITVPPIIGIRNYQVSKQLVSVLSNIWLPFLLYTNQVIMFLHSTARSADILHPGNLAIIPQHYIMVRLVLVHKLSIVNRDPDEIRAIYIQHARQSSVSAFKKEVDESCRHLWKQEIEQGLMYSNYSGLKVRNSIMKMLAREQDVSAKTFRQKKLETFRQIFSCRNVSYYLDFGFGFLQTA